MGVYVQRKVSLSALQSKAAKRRQQDKGQKSATKQKTKRQPKDAKVNGPDSVKLRNGLTPDEIEMEAIEIVVDVSPFVVFNISHVECRVELVMNLWIAMYRCVHCTGWHQG
jgi:hypothetical protein